MRPPPVRFPGILSGFHGRPGEEASGLVHAGESWAASSYAVRTHRHDGWEVYLQADGTSTWRVQGQVVALPAGTVLAVPPGVPHAMSDPSPGRHHFFYAAFDAARVAARHPGVAAAWSGTEPRLAEDGSALEAPFRCLVRELAHDLPLAREGLTAALDLLVVEAARVLAGARARPVLGAVHPAVGRARALLDARYAEAWTTAELARAVGLSSAHLAEVFRREVGVPPHRYLLARRVDRAAELLAGTDLPVTAVAAELGFATASHLARVFRAATGRSPREHRAAARAQPSVAQASVAQPSVAQPSVAQPLDRSTASSQRS